MAKYGTGTKAAVAVGGAVAAGAVGWGAGEVFKIEPGVKRALLGLGGGAVVTGTLAAFKQTRDLALPAGIGTVVGAVGLTVEPAARRALAERKAAKELAAEEQAQLEEEEGAREDTFSYPSPALPTVSYPQPTPAPIVIQQPAPVPKKSGSELWMDFGKSVIGDVADVFGSYLSGSKGLTFGTSFGSAGMTFGKIYMLAAASSRRAA